MFFLDNIVNFSNDELDDAAEYFFGETSLDPMLGILESRLTKQHKVLIGESSKMVTAKKIKKKTSSKSEVKDDFYIPDVGELNQPPEHFKDYCYAIYGQKGIGKTTLCSQLSDKSLVCMFEDRWNTKIRMRAFPSASIEDMENGSPNPWANFKGVVERALDPNNNVDLLIVDTIDLAYQACMNHICMENGVQHPNDLNDYGATWNEIKTEFRTTMETIRKSGTVGLVFISHCNEDRMEINSATKEQLKKLTVYSPSCSKAANEYIRAACDYGFFYGKHGKYRAMHFRWEDNIWTACGNEDHFNDAEGNPIALLEIPSKTTAGKAVTDAFYNRPSTDILGYFEKDEPEEENDTEETAAQVKKKIRRKKSS